MNAPLNTIALNELLLDSPVDTLGMLLAKIDELTKAAEQIKDELKDSCSLTDVNEKGNQRLDVVGQMFKAVVTGGQVVTTDTARLYADFGITEEILAKYKKTPSVRYTVKVTAKG
jgi:hypothetical protein